MIQHENEERDKRFDVAKLLNVSTTAWVVPLACMHVPVQLRIFCHTPYSHHSYIHVVITFFTLLTLFMVNTHIA